MIKHIVGFKFKEEFKNDIQESRRRAMALKGKIDVVRSMEVGLNVLPQERAYDMVLVAEFDSLEALDVYDKHPDHVAYKGFNSGKLAAIMSVDYEV